MKLLDAYLFGDVRASRADLLRRIFLALFGVDLARNLISHAGRYGAGDFNVAHFGWLDALQPVPTPGLYIGLLLTCAGLALVQALLGPRRIPMLVLAGLFTWSWAMSMLDSYQHHYLLSIFLVTLGALPDEPAAPRETPTAEGPGYIALTFSAGLVYAYTAVNKLAPGWRDGSALKRLAMNNREVRELVSGSTTGWTVDETFHYLALGAISVQIVGALAYWLAPLVDRRGSLALRLMFGMGALAALLSFHGMVEIYPVFSIGWFSDYMIATAFVVFLPYEVTDALGRMLLDLRRATRELLQDSSDSDRSPEGKEGESDEAGASASVAPDLLIAGVAAGASLFAGFSFDLPGARAVGFLGAVAVGIRFALAVRDGRSSAVRGFAIALALSAGLTYTSGTHGDTRYDYYRFVGGDLKRRQADEDWNERARDAYRSALRYAPDFVTSCATARKLIQLGEEGIALSDRCEEVLRQRRRRAARGR